MSKVKDNLMKNRIEEVALQLIDKNGGAMNVNLRNIARIIGCSAPNIYNYYESLDDLLNSVMINICEDFKKHMKQKVLSEEKPDEILNAAFRGYIEYAVEYPGRLNFFHFERIQIKVFRTTEDSAESVYFSMMNLMDIGSEGKMAGQDIQEITEILHFYIIGELSEYITGRKQIEDKSRYIDSLVDKCNKIFRALGKGGI